MIDNDGDGQASTSLGSCGKDCDDNDKTIYDGAPELCDNKDNNCNNQVDELAPTWYVDCDADTFAANASGSIQQCKMPTQASGSCAGLKGATWTPKAPGAGTTDCWDKDPDAHPYTAAEDYKAFKVDPSQAHQRTWIIDYNCDGQEEKRYTTYGVSTLASCKYEGSPFALCKGLTGWTAFAVPACGASAQFTGCNVLTCKRYVSTKQQECR